MKKVYGLLVILVGFALLLAGCGSGDADNVDPTDTASSSSPTRAEETGDIGTEVGGETTVMPGVGNADVQLA